MRAEQEFVGKPPFPFGSWWEYVFHLFLIKQDIRWTPQVWVGPTRPDWVIEEKKWALFLDGPVHLYRNKTEHDKYLRDAIRAMGWVVFVWAPPTLEYLKRNAFSWYRSDVEGHGIV